MKKKKLWSWAYAIALFVFTAYILLDAFVIPRSYVVVSSAGTSSAAQNTTTAASTVNATVTDTTYNNGAISVTITQYREYDTDIYVADITLTDASALKTAFANNTFGKNVTAKTSAIANANSAVLAVNGDYYSARGGCVVRDGVIYRDSTGDASLEDLVIYADGSMEVLAESEFTAQELVAKGAVQVLSFGPGLVLDGAVAVGENEEVDQAMTSNPRTAIGWIDGLHYVFVVADGRTSASEGLSLYQLAEFMQTLGVKTAYNLDGGGSSTMVFCGSVVNKPTTNGKTIAERSVSDIVYIG